MGLLTPLGLGLKTNWDKLIAGRSGISRITSMDVSDYPSKIGGEIPFGKGEDKVDLDSLISPKEQRRNDPSVQYGMIAGMQALEDSGYLPKTEEEADRSGILMGSGIGGVQTLANGMVLIKEEGLHKLSPFFIPSAIINMIGGQLAIKYNFKGPNTTVATACATGTHAIGDAVRIIQNDEADVMIAGGAEAAICPCGLGGFSQARALSTHYNDAPEKASRPWDKDRDGFVMGEGAGAVVLEEYEHAKARGAKIYAEVIGYAATCDAYHVTAPGAGGLKAMQLALKRARLNPEDVDYINAHGTSTTAGDMVEFNAVKTIFGNTHVSMSSTKSAIGHLLGAAGAVEVIYSVLAMQTGILPPTLNLDHPEEETAGFDLVPNVAKEKQVRIALSNSFGFGGTNGSIILKKV
ncbi:MAG: beta-ketoacyl-ACP synthase II [Alphaproteobacteria bacterium]|nr:beta-ketoacyl-ACP synthase II [Alphaproteobacteria bacterium]